MLLGTVIGTVWATRKDPGLVGMKFLVVREVGLDGERLDNVVVAADAVGAGEGEVVLVAQGSSGRQTELTEGKAVDAVIMAIVDRLDVAEGEAGLAEAADEAAPLAFETS
jgi:microcompartment protein CcmK/EutM